MTKLRRTGIGTPLVDITTINGIQSLFVPGHKDPWAKKIAGAFADLYVYGDVVRYPLIGFDRSARHLIAKPTLLTTMSRLDGSALVPIPFSIAEPRTLRHDHLLHCFGDYADWVQNNVRTLRKWITLHRQPWIHSVPGNAYGDYVFSLEDLQDHPLVTETAATTGLTPKELFFAFDVILRYPLYGEMAGRTEWYLNHPIRASIGLPDTTRGTAPAPGVAVSFEHAISRLAPSLTMEEYCVLLHELRGAVRDRGLHSLRHGDIDKDEIRELASEVRLPPRLSNLARRLGLVGGIIGGLGAIPALGPFAAVAGALISVASSYWEGDLPRAMARIEWLHWALVWDVESQAESRD